MNYFETELSRFICRLMLNQQQTIMSAASKNLSSKKLKEDGSASMAIWPVSWRRKKVTFYNLVGSI